MTSHKQIPTRLAKAVGIVSVTLGIVATLCLQACSGAGSASGTASAEQQTTSQDQSATEDKQGLQNASSSSSSQQQDTRATEFSVDPSRTDWNFEAPETKTVYLTFDDGPSENTAPVLDVLDQYGIKATFFVTGINPSYFDMIKECHDRGHTIGLHTYSHDYAEVYSSVDAYWADLDRIGAVVQEQIGYVPCFIRFPGGSSNTISANYTQGIMTELSQEVVDAGYQYYDWDASCGDGAEHTADELVEATMADAGYGYQSIVFLMHDGAAKETTVEALPRIIEWFQSEGYSFAAIDRSTCVPHHGIGN